MKQEFERSFHEYLRAKQVRGPHPLRAFVSTTLANHFRQLIEGRQYTVKGSTGVGNWAAVPWLCIFDRDITDSATHGIYVCYLFRADMTGVYLSLNQGWTFFENKHRHDLNAAKLEIREVALAWRSILAPTLNEFTFDDIHLRDDGKLAKGYELGHICGKFYDAANLPDDPILKADLDSMIGVYREVKGNMLNPSDLASTNEEIVIMHRISEETDDRKFQEQVYRAQPRFTTAPQPKSSPQVLGVRNVWPRDPAISQGALIKANYLCEFDPSHITYTSKTTGKNYVEAHHLIPMSLQDRFSYSLDVTANIVSLCRNCHGRIHYAIQAEKREMIIKLFNQRRTSLKEHGLEVTLEELLKIYE